MTTTTTARRGVAIAAGLVLAAGGTSLLFGDVIFGATTFTQKHFQTIAIVLGTMLAAHAACETFSWRLALACFGFVAITAAGSALIIYNSLGRQNETFLMSVDEHDQKSAKRTRLKERLATETKTLQQKREDADAACRKSPDGDRCAGSRAVEAVWKDSVAGIEAQIDALKPVRPIDAAAEKFGSLAAEFDYDEAQATAFATMLMPYLITLFFEFGTTYCLGFGFRPGRRTARLTERMPNGPQSEQSDFPTLNDDESPNLQWFGPAEPNGSPNRRVPGGAGRRKPNRPNGSPNGGRLVRQFSKEEAAADLATRLALGERFGSQDELAERYGVAKSTMSDWLGEWERFGLVPNRTKRGRCKALAKLDD